MKKKEFLEKYSKTLKQNTEKIDNLDRIEGIIGNKEDRQKVNFNGIYVIFDENDEVIYIGSAYAQGFSIGERLEKHLGCNKTNTSLAENLVKMKNISLKDAKILISNYKFMAFKHKSLEYYLIENTPNLYNKKGNNNK